jgi:hypothetical protein
MATGTRAGIGSQSHLVAYLRNIANLKEVLKERRSQRREFFEWMFEGDIF